jgi:DNA-binding MarR family transcriptional regulator
VRKSSIDRIFQEIQQVRYRLDDIEAALSKRNPSSLEISESKLLSLPDNLRRTYLIVASKGECSATQVSDLTGRSRPVESCYLNQLVRMGWLTRRRDSKTVNFCVISEEVFKGRSRHT